MGIETTITCDSCKRMIGEKEEWWELTIAFESSKWPLARDLDIKVICPDCKPKIAARFNIVVEEL